MTVARNGGSDCERSERRSRQRDPARIESGALLLGLSFLLLLGGATTASANVCKEVCSDARTTCMQARKIAYRSCASGCRETIEQAITDARAVCEQQQLGEKACRKLVKRTVQGAHAACRADCRVDAKLQKTGCRAERRECRATCAEAVDPECREPCVDQFEQCREEQRACVDVCRDERGVAVEACKDQMGEVCDAVVLRECIAAARADSRACAEDCHVETSCGETLRECIGDCVDDLDDETGTADAIN